MIADLPNGPQLPVFNELAPDLYSTSSDTFIRQISTEFGLANVADVAHDPPSLYPSGRWTGSIPPRWATYVLWACVRLDDRLRYQLSREQSPQERA
jgi:hypothetical protein